MTTHDDEMQEAVSPYRQACDALIDTIQATGGIYYDRKGLPCCVGDKASMDDLGGWPDLADAYLQACRACKVRPRIVKDPWDDPDNVPM